MSELHNELYGLAQGLKKLSGRLEKESYLEMLKDNENWKQYLKYTLDSLLVYGIQDKKLKKAIKEIENRKVYNSADHQTLFDIFEYLLANNTGTDKDAMVVAGFIKSQPEEHQEWLIESITKSFKMGVTAKTVNKALKEELIAEFEIQRGKSYSDYRSKVKTKEKHVTEKFNGVRGIAFVTDGSVRIISRQNKELTGLNDIMKDMSTLENGIYEGELIIKDRHRFKLREVLQETMKVLAAKTTDKSLDYFIFDYLTFEEFANPSKSRKYFERYDNSPVHDIHSTNIQMAEILYRGKEEDIIFELLEKIVEQGGEGLMVNLNLPYKKGKTDNILKVKKKYTSDLRVLALEEGKGKLKGTLGAFVLDYKGNTLNCGIMSDDVRHQVWNDPDTYIGSIVEIFHEQETSNQNNDLLSVEYPVFSALRPDKDEVDYAHE